jgi:cysteine synthase B
MNPHEIDVAVLASRYREYIDELQELDLSVSARAIRICAALLNIKAMALDGENPLQEEEPEKYFYPNQYSNLANPKAHHESTAAEIWEQTRGEITHFVAGLGTSGTFVGTASGLKELDPSIELISFEPDSPLHGLEGMKHMESSMIPEIYDPSIADRNLSTSTEEAYATVKRLAREEGLLVGISAGAAVATALRVAGELETATVVTVLPDGASKYLSESFWEEED